MWSDSTVSAWKIMILIAKVGSTSIGLTTCSTDERLFAYLLCIYLQRENVTIANLIDRSYRSGSHLKRYRNFSN